jgi:hypothetical protein
MNTETDLIEKRTASVSRSRSSRVWIIIIGVLAAIAIAGLVLWLAGVFGGKSGGQIRPVVGQPAFVSENDLRAYGDENGPLYWAGPASDVNYELTVTTSGAVFIRYVPKDEGVGTTTEVLTVATYPEQHGYEKLAEAATQEDMGSQITQSEALVVVNSRSPQSTYFSFPDAAFQVEVFAPEEGVSEKRVVDGDIQLLGSGR